MSQILQVTCHRCNTAIKIASKSVRSFSVRENWELYKLVIVKNKRDRLHNKGLYHKGQYKVTFFCTKGLSIQTNKRMETSASLYEGPIFYFYLLPFIRVMVIFTLPFYILSFGKHNMLERSWYIWLIGCEFSWTLTIDITLEVKRWEAKL